MQIETYLEECLRKDKLSRWEDGSMPLPVFIGNFNWYKSKGSPDEIKYTQMVIDGFNYWEKASGGLVSFRRTMDIYESQINVEWRRVDRKSLGTCYYNIDKFGRYYSATVSIGLSDGILHKKYMDENEVFHTIVHEIGHSIGLGHSKKKGDIMYVPHEYGVIKISPNDIETLKWIYRFPCGKTKQEIISSYPNIKAYSLDNLISKMSSENAKSEFEKTIDEVKKATQQKDLSQENANIGDLKKYLLQINNIKVNYKPKN